MTDLTEHQLDELEDLIVQEKMQAALEHQNDVWASCVAEGIEPEILIDANMAMPSKNQFVFMVKTRRKIF